MVRLNFPQPVPERLIGLLSNIKISRLNPASGMFDLHWFPLNTIRVTFWTS